MISKFNTVFFFIGIVFIGGLFFNGTTRRTTDLPFVAYIVQDGKQLPIDKHIVRAKKAPFQIVIEMKDGTGIFVSGSLKSQTYNQIIRNVDPEKLHGFKGVANYELWKNPSKEFYIEGEGPNYWFIESPAKHRFSSYEKINGKFICKREVDHIYDLNSHEEVPFESISKPLYMSFIKFASLGDNYRHMEIMRHGFIIEWE